MTLYEEFSGENCDSCATINPAFWFFCDGGSNPNKLIHITYMSPIPSAGTLYLQDQVVSDTRIAYYDITAAPNGIYDGYMPDLGCHGGIDPGYPSCFTQADVDSEAAIPDSFIMTVTNSWNATYDSVICIVRMTTNTKWTATLPRLRIALVENVDFGTAPGNNGEKYFEHVVRDMYPGPLGINLDHTFAADTTIIDTVIGAVPAYVDKSGSPFVVAWIQNDANKFVSQAAQAIPLPKIPLDATITAVNSPANIKCEPAGTYTFAHSATLLNSGSTPLTSATIYYKVDSGTLSSYTWTGILAATSTTAVVMPTATVSVGADVYHTIYDSVAVLNGTTDINPDAAAASTYFFIENSTGAAIPFGTSFENPDDTSYYATDYLNDGNTWSVYWSGTASPSLAHTGNYAIGAALLDFPQGEKNILALPEIDIPLTGPIGITFWEAYAQQDSSSDDTLEVVYSTDCGATWTSIWNMSGSPMATLAASTTSIEIPITPSQYAERFVSLGSLPAGNVIPGFRFTQEGGNSIWIDDINVHVTTAIQNLANTPTNINIYPNPAKDETMLSFYLPASSNIQVQVVDELGRTVSIVANDNMNAGVHNININTYSLSNGIYNITLRSESGVFTKLLSIIR